MTCWSTGLLRCVHCNAIIEPPEARAADGILARLTEEAFWEALDAMGPPDLAMVDAIVEMGEKTKR